MRSDVTRRVGVSILPGRAPAVIELLVDDPPSREPGIAPGTVVESLGVLLDPPAVDPPPGVVVDEPAFGAVERDPAPLMRPDCVAPVPVIVPVISTLWLTCCDRSTDADDSSLYSSSSFIVAAAPVAAEAPADDGALLSPFSTFVNLNADVVEAAGLLSRSTQPSRVTVDSVARGLWLAGGGDCAPTPI